MLKTAKARQISSKLEKLGVNEKRLEFDLLTRLGSSNFRTRTLGKKLGARTWNFEKSSRSILKEEARKLGKARTGPFYTPSGKGTSHKYDHKENTN